MFQVLYLEPFLFDHKVIPENDLRGQIESKEQCQDGQD